MRVCVRAVHVCMHACTACMHACAAKYKESGLRYEVDLDHIFMYGDYISAYTSRRLFRRRLFCRRLFLDTAPSILPPSIHLAVYL